MRWPGMLLFLLAGSAAAEEGAPWRLLAEHRAGSMPWGVVASGDAVHVAHVGYKGRDNVWRYQDGQVTARSRFPGHAVELDVSADGKTVYAANSRGDEVLVLDAVSLAVTGRHATGDGPKDLVLAPDQRTLFVGNFNERSLTVIDLAGGEARAVAVGDGPRGVDVTRDGKKLYVANLRSGTVSVVDTASLRVTATIPTCRGAAHTALTPDDRLLLVTCYRARHLAVIDVAEDRKLREVEVGRAPNPVRVTPDGAHAVVASEADDSLSTVDLATWRVTTQPLPVDRPVGLAFSPAGDQLYVTARGSTKLLVYAR
jgi:YVTN family beta-propeller protein